MSKVFHVFYKNYLLSNTSWHIFLQIFQETQKLNSLGKNCEVQSK